MGIDLASTDNWHGYPTVYNLGHPEVSSLFAGDVVIEEKVDGSQFSFGKFGGELRCRSKGQQIILDAAPDLFAQAVDTVIELGPDLPDGTVYRGEVLIRPKHNALKYDRVPTRNIIIFDISPSYERYMDPMEKAAEAHRLGLEVVPLLYWGSFPPEGADAANIIKDWIETESVLGGVNREGVVIKNYSQFGRDHKVLMGKFVSEAFKEVHSREWGKSNPVGKDIVQILSDKYRTEARWHKAIQHLRDNGIDVDTVRAIGPIMKEIAEDVRKECEAPIKEELFKWAWPTIHRKVTAGFPEWFKEQLLVQQFSPPEEDKSSLTEFLTRWSATHESVVESYNNNNVETSE